MDRVFDSADCKACAEALDFAWEIFLKTGRLTSRNLDVAKGALSFAILEVAASGERQPRRLAMCAIARMAKYEAKLLAERSWHRGPVHQIQRQLLPAS